MLDTIKKERIQKFDIARTFAILCVVICHSADTVYSNINYMQLSNVSQIFRIIILTIGRLGVPVFLLLTGALTLKKQIDKDQDVIKFYKKNLLPLFITIEIWNIFYNIFLAMLNKQLDIKILLENIFFLKQVNLPNMWYMPMILGMYLAIPFVAKIVKTFTLKTLKIPIILVFTSTILLPSVNVFLRILDLEQYALILDFGFLGGAYGLYILMGYYINNGLLKKYNNISIIAVAIISFLVTCIIQYITYKIKNAYYVWYNFILLFICSMCLFELFIRIKNKENKNFFIKLTEYISKISLGIFFIHEIFLKIFVKFTVKISLNNPLECILIFILTTVFSITFIYLTSKIKIIRERIFLIKG